MAFPFLFRKTHYWASIAVALPVLVIIVSGILLHMKKDIAWIQPREMTGVGTEPGLPPALGMLKVLARNGWEIQIDAKTGDVLQVAYRRSDWIESIHDGTWFHPLAKYWLFLPAGVILLYMLISGAALFLQPLLRRRRSRMDAG